MAQVGVDGGSDWGDRLRGEVLDSGCVFEGGAASVCWLMSYGGEGNGSRG